MDVLRLVTREPRDDDRAWYVADPDVLYPQGIAYLEALAQQEDLGPPAIARYVLEARRLPPGAFELARRPRAALDPTDLASREVRAHVLELVRLTCTALLRAATSGPIGLHILAGDRRWQL